MPDDIAYISCDTDGVLWNKVPEAGLGPIDFRALDKLGNKDDIEVALAWKPPGGLIASFPNAQPIVSLGMAVDRKMARVARASPPSGRLAERSGEGAAKCP